MKSGYHRARHKGSPRYFSRLRSRLKGTSKNLRFFIVIPAKAGIQPSVVARQITRGKHLRRGLDSGLRRNDE
jgi:hypothetical protein